MVSQYKLLENTAKDTCQINDRLQYEILQNCKNMYRDIVNLRDAVNTYNFLLEEDHNDPKNLLPRSSHIYRMYYILNIYEKFLRMLKSSPEIYNMKLLTNVNQPLKEVIDEGKLLILEYHKRYNKDLLENFRHNKENIIEYIFNNKKLTPGKRKAMIKLLTKDTSEIFIDNRNNTVSKIIVPKINT